MAELATGRVAAEPGVDFNAVAIHQSIPGAHFRAQDLQIGDSSDADALP